MTIIHVASKRTYDVPRIHAELRRQGRLVNRKRVERLMHEHGIAGHSRSTGRRSLTRADRKAAWAPDLLGRDFTAAAPGLRVVSDITYIPTGEGGLYLATWLDLATRGSVTRWPIITALAWPSTPSTWPLAWAYWRTAASSTRTADRSLALTAAGRQHLS